jgi:hypothetical protein
MSKTEIAEITEVLEVIEVIKNDKKLVLINKTIDQIFNQVSDLKIESKIDFEISAELLSDVLIKKRELADYWKPSIDAAFETKKKATEALRKLRDMEEESGQRLIEAEGILKRSRQNFKNEQDRLARAEQKRLQDIADKKAAKEQEKLLKKAEKAPDVATEERLIEEADEIVSEPIFVKPVIQKSERTKTGTLNTWVEEIQVEIVDVKKICTLIGNGALPVDCATINPAKIKVYVKAFDKKDGKYEGYNVRRIQKERVRLDGRN